jgi:ribosomal protein L40E
MNIDRSELTSLYLIEKAKELGLLESNLTTLCAKCNAVFPKEYQNCPQCKFD